MMRDHEEGRVPEEELADVDFESEEEFGGVGAYKQKLAKLKAELDGVKKERAEYLDGWQRCKADMVNMRRDTLQSVESAKQRAQENLLEELVPVMDSFDMAMQGEAWQSVDATWRVGVESIASQLVRALQSVGAQPFGAVGEAFDHELHHAVGEVDEGDAPDTIARVVRRGWKMGNRIVRPAEVIVVRG